MTESRFLWITDADGALCLDFAEAESIPSLGLVWNHGGGYEPDIRAGTRAVAKVLGRKSDKQDDVEAGCQPMSLLSILEAENVRLWQAVAALMRDTLALCEALKRRQARGHAVYFRTPL